MRLIPFCLLLIFAASCGSDKNANLKSLNLLEYEVPLTIMAPDSVDILKQDYGMSQLVTVKSQKSGDYNVGILFQDVTGSMEEIKNSQLGYIKGAYSDFKVLLDEPSGFIFETKIEPSIVNYGFRRIVIMGAKEYVFQNSIGGTYTKEQVEELYELTLPEEVKAQ